MIGYLLTALLSASALVHAAPQADESLTWDLSAIFKNEDEFKAAKQAVVEQIPNLKACQGKLGSADSLKKCLDLKNNVIDKKMRRISGWASLLKSGDRKIPLNLERDDEATDLSAKVSEASAFFEPEILAVGREKVDKMISKNPGLQEFAQYLRTVLDMGPHILDQPRSEMIAALSPVLWGREDLQGTILSADLPWTTITVGGKKEKIDVAGYSKLRESPNRADRKKVFAAFYASLTQFQRTLGQNLANAIKVNVITAHLQKWPSALASVLGAEQIPEKVYRTLIQEVNNGLPVFQDYLKLKKESLHTKTMDYVDAYTAGDKFDRKFSPAESKKILLEAVQPLGDDYQKRLKAALDNRWMDILPREGKANGGFMNGSIYDVHPFLLLNHQDDYSSLSTMAHEWGHAMHSVYTNETQPLVNSNYSTFIAEIASQVNEVLLNHYMVNTAKTAKEKSYYLESLLFGIRSSFFRQAQFAEFELALYEELEKNGTLNGPKMSEMYGKIARRYYGHDKGVMQIDPVYFSEWAYVPHFYYRFYVYQYSTCMAAAFYFADRIIKKEPGAVESYLTLLKSGASKYPTELLKQAGVDMEDPAVYRSVVDRMANSIKELRELRKTK